MNKALIDQIKPGNGYSVVKEQISNIVFSVVSHGFSPETLEGARISWQKSPGKYNDTIMGVTTVSTRGNILHINISPMKYSVHRYIAQCIRNSSGINEQDRIFPIGVASTSYITKGNKREFLMGIKKSGNIEGGKLEFIPQGFCNPTEDSDLSSYVHNTISREFKEELTDIKKKTSPEIPFKQSYLGLIFDSSNFHYGIQVECAIENNGKNFPSKAFETEEHERVILVDESELEMLVEDTTTLVHRKAPEFKARRFEIPVNTKALLYCYLKKNNKL